MIMVFKYLKSVRLIIIMLVWAVPFFGAKADYFAYVPDVTSKYLYAFNTSLNIPVESIRLFGSPRNVQVNYAGTKVFVSTVVIDGSLSQSYLNIINTTTNQREFGGLIPVPGANVRGLVISRDDQNLFITHDKGVTRIESPGTLNTVTDLELSYSGMNLVISDDDKYLFVIGTDAFDDGISVVDLATFTEVSSISLGANQGANEIVFDNNNLKLFVAKTISDQVVAVNVNNYMNAESLSLELAEERTFRLGSSPVDLALHKNSSELLVVLSYIENDQTSGTGDGNIVILKTADISADNTDEVNQIFFDNENSTGGNANGIIHPLAVNIDENGFIYVLKQIWSDVTGIYVEKLRDSTDLKGERSIEKKQSYNLGNKVSTLANGQFMGPNCSSCPTGYEDPFGPVERPAAINPLFLSLIAACILFFRRFKFF